MKTILITGCSSGIGHDAAHGLKARGWRVIASARAPEDVARLQAEGLEAVRLDMADPASIAEGFAAALALTGRLDALYNNAAFAIPARSKTCPWARCARFSRPTCSGCMT